jgi:hypothetical protein
VNIVNNISMKGCYNMESYVKMLHATKMVGATLLTIGIAIFLYGALLSELSAVIGVGIGVVMGAVFIFLIGMILVASEEMILNSNKYKKESA